MKNKYKINRFYKKNNNWLNDTLELSKIIEQSNQISKSFNESSNRTKRKKTEFRSMINMNEIIFVAQMKLQSSRKKKYFGNIKKHITHFPKQVKKYKTVYLKLKQKNNEKLLPLKVLYLSMFVQTGLLK